MCGSAEKRQGWVLHQRGLDNWLAPQVPHRRHRLPLQAGGARAGVVSGAGTYERGPCRHGNSFSYVAAAGTYFMSPCRVGPMAREYEDLASIHFSCDDWKHSPEVKRIKTTTFQSNGTLLPSDWIVQINWKPSNNNDDDDDNVQHMFSTLCWLDNDAVRSTAETVSCIVTGYRSGDITWLLCCYCCLFGQMLLQEENRGIEYQYNLPVNDSATDHDISLYTWGHSPWSPCTKSCSTGQFVTVATTDQQVW